MSVYNLMRTGTSGMAAQGNRLGTVADNIANVNTVGYKAAEAQFSSLVLNSTTSEYTSGGVVTDVRYGISAQGNLQFTNSSTDLAVNGSGFFFVETPGGEAGLTRAGSFVPNGDGSLVNAAGYRLMGYPVQAGGNTVVANGTAGLEPVSVVGQSLAATPSTSGTLRVNLPSNADIVAAGSLPSDNVLGGDYSAKSSLVTFDGLGNEVIVDAYFTKTGAAAWEVAVYRNSDADPATLFPYASAPLATQTLSFNPAAGTLTGASTVSFTVPGGSPLNLDLSGTTQLAADYSVLDVEVDGNAPSGVASLEFTEDGFVYAVFENGARKPTYRIPLGNVISPDRLLPKAGNVFWLTSDSGDLKVGFPADSGFGSIVSGALEGSTVDLASELTTMIEAQRNYTANSKVFQTGSELLEVVVNLKR
ncbi:MAG: flagellar biosynthesis protein FlgE [Alphaproteobacteria bacterium BRH_c36]|nr:MAG: flagellar biosynthesis protein FlgE [Alphaproteobacteria bacterium BRH_c36]